MPLGRLPHSISSQGMPHGRLLHSISTQGMPHGWMPHSICTQGMPHGRLPHSISSHGMPHGRLPLSATKTRVKHPIMPLGCLQLSILPFLNFFSHFPPLQPINIGCFHSFLSLCICHRNWLIITSGLEIGPIFGNSTKWICRNLEFFP